MPSTFDHARLPQLVAQQWRELHEFFVAEERRTVMVHELANSTSLTQAQALALLDCLANDHAVDLLVLAYHDCSEAPCRVRRLADGPLRGEVRCSHCDEEVRPELLSYDVMAKVCAELPKFDDG